MRIFKNRIKKGLFFNFAAAICKTRPDPNSRCLHAAFSKMKVSFWSMSLDRPFYSIYYSLFYKKESDASQIMRFGTESAFKRLYKLAGWEKIDSLHDFTSQI